MSDRRLDGAALRDWAQSAVGDLIAHADEINRLNVFPVADADTGTNMLFTMRAAAVQVEELARSGAPDVAGVAAALSAGALRGARGNSGVILSQILRAMADVTASAAVDTGGEFGAIDTETLAAVLRHAVGLVVSSLGDDAVAGTIVSVLQAAAAAAERGAGDGDGLAQAVLDTADAAAVALEATPRQLPVLAEAGVVDSGGRGLLVLLDALAGTVTGRRPPRGVYHPAPPSVTAEELIAGPTPQFEVMYTLDTTAGDGVGRLRDRLDELGDSVTIAAGSQAGSYAVHVHTDDAGAVIEAGLVHGRPGHIQIAALTGGQGVAPGGWSRERAVLAVVDGDGAAALFAAEGAAVLTAGPDLAVTAHRLLRAVVDTGAAQVMVLPNGYVAAEELVAGCTAAIGWGIDVVPLPARSMVAGLAALAVHDPARLAVDDGYNMAAAVGGTRYGSVRRATEDALTWAGPCRAGDGLGIFGGEVLVVRHDVTAAGQGLIDLMLGVGGELLTVLLGHDLGSDAERIAEALADHVRAQHLGTEMVSYHTGQHGDAMIIGVE